MNENDRRRARSLSTGISPRRRPSVAGRLYEDLGPDSDSPRSGPKRYKQNSRRDLNTDYPNTDDLVHEVISAAEEFIRAIRTESNSVDEIEVIVRANPEQIMTIRIALNDFLSTTPDGDRVSVIIIRELPSFRVKFFLREPRADSPIIVPDLTAETGNVEINTTAGLMEYEPPIDVLKHSYTSTEVGRILTYSEVQNRMTAQRLRNKSELIGLPIGNQFYHPKFQISVREKRVIDVVAFANKALSVNEDPWGGLSWWFTGSELYSGSSPYDLLMANVLDEEKVRILIESDSLGMG